MSGKARDRLALGVRPEDLEHLDSIDDQLRAQTHGLVEEPLPLETTTDVRAFVRTWLDALCADAAMRAGLPHHWRDQRPSLDPSVTAALIVWLERKGARFKKPTSRPRSTRA